MLHARRAIVRAAVQRLAGLPSVVGGVHEGRYGPKSASSAPFLLVYARPESSAPITTRGSGRALQRELTLAIDAVVAESGVEAGDALFDALALEIETALAADPTLGGACRDLWLARTNPDAVTTGAGEHRAGAVRLEFTVTYFTPAAAPHQAL